MCKNGHSKIGNSFIDKRGWLRCKSCMEESKTKKQERNRAYYERNRERLRADCKRRYQENREKYLAAQKVRGKKYYQENRERILEETRRRYLLNEGGRYDRKSFLFQQRWKKWRMDVFQSLGGPVCVRCGYEDVRALQVDHVNGGGHKHMRSFSSHSSYFQYIKDNPTEFQVLCANCNHIKVVENREVRTRNLAA